MLAVLIQNAFVGMATSSDDAKMLLNIPFPMNHVIIDLLALNLVDICLDNSGALSPGSLTKIVILLLN